ncbi:MAG: response regulator [Bacteroidota bacterium]
MHKSISCFLVDDDKDDQEIFGLALEKIALPVALITADDGYLALEKFDAEPDFIPDFIFLDLNMPRINGIQCLTELKKAERLRDIPVIIFSTSSEQSHKDQIRTLGAEGFITKPSSINELAKLLSDVFNKRATHS